MLVHLASSPGVGGEHHPALLVEDPDPVDALFPRDRLHDLVGRVPLSSSMACQVALVMLRESWSAPRIIESSSCRSCVPDGEEGKNSFDDGNEDGQEEDELEGECPGRQRRLPGSPPALAGAFQNPIEDFPRPGESIHSRAIRRYRPRRRPAASGPSVGTRFPGMELRPSRPVDRGRRAPAGIRPRSRPRGRGRRTCRSRER